MDTGDIDVRERYIWSTVVRTPAWYNFAADRPRIYCLHPASPHIIGTPCCRADDPETYRHYPQKHLVAFLVGEIPPEKSRSGLESNVPFSEA